ncbi:dihydroxyacetone kinase phosphoryl donor subunit DhaM [Nocardia sp. NBC_01503]|uniref:dihydroxyacetone kinase phosphoryl donor subunit DhaM n=1 Tax=Nocardia sp. NBC_01503 TaxID=2975997 RepID=UPI002E7BE23E|nr:dihydroxyacetone kinase phosphoryl donor subunit DhaM [Nocardia sp. NBC_01503]WTL34862.1 dihydroxyacetone kinase phosphoryl donor subunit DhaM [Nocardia sp. NBC_01503]
MIGLVVVSHSRPLARAAVALATELLPTQPVRIEMAAGAYENALGTDAVAVAEAITAADSGDGVLVLMDLGSAVLSAETAVELLESPVRVHLCTAPFVEGLIAALASAGGGADLETVAREAENALDAKRAQLGQPAAPDAPAPPSPATAPRTVAVLEVTDQHGLHARPAAELVAALRDLDADIELRNATTGAGPVSADSLTRVLTLGVSLGHQLEVSALGPDAPAAIDRVRAAISGP